MSQRATALDVIEELLGQRPSDLHPLSGGCIAEVYRVDLPDGNACVAKIDLGSRTDLRIEALMLQTLAERSRLPVPEVLASSARALVMEYIESSGGPDERGRHELADAVAELHHHTAERFGLECDTLIGPERQPNPQSEDWPEFFAEQRVRHFSDLASASGQITAQLHGRCHAAADRIRRWLDNDELPTLIHGDLWSGNVLWRGGRLAAVIDPAVHYAHREVELAFMDLFGSFGEGFWRAYDALMPIRDGFWQHRRHVYRVYPLLVHTALFGGGYASMLDRELRLLGV